MFQLFRDKFEPEPQEQMLVAIDEMSEIEPGSAINIQGMSTSGERIQAMKQQPFIPVKFSPKAFVNYKDALSPNEYSNLNILRKLERIEKQQDIIVSALCKLIKENDKGIKERDKGE